MPDLVLRDGREITLDMYKIDLEQWRKLREPCATEAEQLAEDTLIADAAGLTVEEYRHLPQPDWRKLISALWRKGRDPLSDPS